MEIQMRQRKILFKVLKLFEILQKSNFNSSDHLSKEIHLFVQIYVR